MTLSGNGLGGQQPGLGILSIEENAEMVSAVGLDDELSEFAPNLIGGEYRRGSDLVVHELLEHHSSLPGFQIKKGLW